MRFKFKDMLGNQNIMAFVATADAAKARPFYEETLGLTVKSEDPYGIMFDRWLNYTALSKATARLTPFPAAGPLE